MESPGYQKTPQEDPKDSTPHEEVIIPMTITELVKEEKKNIHFICFDLSQISPRTQFGILSALIFGLYLTYGCTHEFIFRIPGMKDKGWSITALQFLFFSLFSKMEMLIRGHSRKASLSIYFLLAFITLGTMGFSNASLQYLNYPTQVIFKSCKLIPVLIGGSIIQGKTYGSMYYIAAFVTSLGLVLFMTVDITVNLSFNFIGVVMISIALVADAFLGNYQERAMKHFETSNAELTYYTFTLGAGMLLTSLGIFGDIPGTLRHFNSNPLTIYGSIFTFSLCGYLGIQAVFSMIRGFGAFTTVLVTSLRKALTIVLSFIVFGKPFTMGYVYSGIILFFGIYLNLLAKKGYEPGTMGRRWMSFLQEATNMFKV